MQGSISQFSHSKRLFLYQSNTYTGDSGAAVILADGVVVGVHREGVNAAKARTEQEDSLDERMAEVEHSVDSLVKNTSSGSIATYVGCEQFQALLKIALEKAARQQQNRLQD